MPERGFGSERRDHVRHSWPKDPRALGRLRAEVRAWLAPLGLSVDVCDDIVLAANEAAANAIDHAYPAGTPGTLDMDLWIENGTAHVRVSDHGRWQPADDVPSYRGLGIRLMRLLLDDVVIDTGPAGTSVLLRHSLPHTNGRRVGSHDVGGAGQNH